MKKRCSGVNGNSTPCNSNVTKWNGKCYAHGVVQGKKITRGENTCLDLNDNLYNGGVAT